MKKKLSVLLCAAMVAASLAGCGGSSGAKTETTAAEASQGGQESAAEGKILTYAISGEPETLDRSCCRNVKYIKKPSSCYLSI